MAATQVGLNLVYVLGVVARVGNIARETAQILRPDTGVRIVLYKDHLLMLKHAMYIPAP